MIAGIGEDALDEWKPTPRRAEQLASTIRVLHVGRVDTTFALLRWAAADLVRESGVHLATIHRAESVDGMSAMKLANASATRRALENAERKTAETRGSFKAALVASIVSRA